MNSYQISRIIHLIDLTCFYGRHPMDFLLDAKFIFFLTIPKKAMDQMVKMILLAQFYVNLMGVTYHLENFIPLH